MSSLLLVQVVLASLLTVLLLLLNNEIKKQKKPKRREPYAPIRSDRKPATWETKVARAYKTAAPYRKLNTSPPAKPSSESVPRSSKNHSVNSSTKQKLYYLTGGDQKSAERLVEQILLKHPGKSEQWAYEKAIWDLERDRF